MAFDDAILFEQFHGPIDRRQRDVLIDRIGSAMELFCVRMI
eukprot:CAMPEP_0184423134 /NCGR_PEP_ID=MMETSP0738-20130409/87081_1 /TAXON_ID=385413 /ORGANISM="Thalassiosira miniscula, Strain CCMP1093" /LENGTH=40 /DNA_ID= /DNA_START= /DNA_END= /DNA_ORIENTATION=